MTKGAPDIEDMLNYLVYFTFSFISFDWMNVPGLDFLDFHLLELSSPTVQMVVTFPRLVLIASLIYLLWTNDLDWSSYSFYQIALVGIMIWLIFAPAFVPIFYVLTNSIALSSLVAFFIQSAAWTIVMWMG